MSYGSKKNITYIAIIILTTQTTNANGFGIMSLITIMFVAPLSSDNWGLRRHRSVSILLL